MSSAKRRSFCLGLNVLKRYNLVRMLFDISPCFYHKWDKFLLPIFFTLSNSKWQSPGMPSSAYPVMGIIFFFNCDQAAPWMVQFVCQSIYLFVRHTFLTMFPSSYHYDIFGVNTIDRSDVHAKSRSKVKVTKVKTNLAPIWAFPDHNSSLNLQMSTKWCTKLGVTYKGCLIVFKFIL